jgi:hypothetical protein
VLEFSNVKPHFILFIIFRKIIVSLPK